jgi:hypothetical protein
MDRSVGLKIQIHPCGDTVTYIDAACATLRAGTALSYIPIIGDMATVEDLDRLLPQTRLRAVLPSNLTTNEARPDSLDRLLESAGQPGDSHRMLIVERHAPEAVPAVFFALATRRSVVLTNDLADYPARLAGSDSAILAASPDRLGKRFLKSLLDWSQSGAAAPRQLGVLTGRNVVQIANTCAKLLIARARHASGAWLPDPRLALGAASCEFELIAAHGNEIHMNYRRDKTLCGRIASLTLADSDAFDCGCNCPLDNRVDASTIAATTVLLMSCDAFTPSGGVAPSNFSVLFRLLDGQPSAVLAPFKHVQANEPLLIMMEAMARSGYTLGEIAHLINARANVGILPDYGFLVLGDPEIRVVSPPARGVDAVKITETSRGLVVRAELDHGCHALTVTVPTVCSDSPLAVLPISANARSPGTFFALGRSSEEETTDVTLFREVAFERGLFEFALMPACRPGEGELSRGRDALNRARLLTHVFGSGDALATAEAAIWRLLKTAVAFPRPIELACNQKIMINLNEATENLITDLRRCACDRILEILAERRIWISQEYAELYADVRRAGPEFDSDCPHCGNAFVAWAYVDRITHLPRRHVLICNRCGIIADTPADTPLRVSFPTIGNFRIRDEVVEISVTNIADTPVEVSLALQLNEWRTQGLNGFGCRTEFDINPKETCSHTVRLQFPEGFHDDILSVQLFLVDGSLDVLFFSQKVQSTVRPCTAGGF